MGLVHLILFSCHSTVLSLSNTYAFLACESHLSAESSGIAKLGKTRARAQQLGAMPQHIGAMLHQCSSVPVNYLH